MARVTTIQSAFPSTASGGGGASVIDAFFAEETLGVKGKSAKQQQSLRGGSAVNYTKLFDDFIHLSETDHVTFFTVFANHPNLHLAIAKAVSAAEGSICSATKGSHRFTKRQLGSVAIFAVRALADFAVTHKRGSGGASIDLDPMTYCGRLQLLFPASIWMPLAHLVAKVDGQSASVVFNSLGMCCPGTLVHLPAAIMIWCDELHALSNRVTSEAKRGRFQRSNGDIVSLFERSFALIQGFWSLVDSNPMAVVPFLPVVRVLETLSTHTNVVCPLMQHFLLNCDSLIHHRKQLSNVNSMIINASVSAASMVVLFYPFKPADAMREAAARDGLSFTKAVTLRSYTVPSLVEQYEHEVVDALMTFLNPRSVPVVLIENTASSSTSSSSGCGGKSYSVLQVLDAIAPIQEKDEPSSNSKRKQGGGKKRGATTGAIGEVVADYTSIISSGGMSLSEVLMPLVKNAAEAAAESPSSNNNGTHFIRALLGELVNQGGGVDEWAARGLVNLGDAQQLGSNASDDHDHSPVTTTAIDSHIDPEQAAIDAAIAASMEDAGDSAAAASAYDDGLGGATKDEREQVGLVMDIAPIITSVSVALAALRYYNGDLEALIVDATSDNMPPHILNAAVPSAKPSPSTAAVAASSSSSPAAASSGPTVATTTTTGTKEGYLNVHSFLFSHWNAYQNDAAEEGGDDEDDYDEQDEENEEDGWEVMATTAGGGGRGQIAPDQQLFSSPNDSDMHAVTQMLVDQLLYEDERDDGQDYEAEAIIPVKNANHRVPVGRSTRSKYGNDDSDDEPRGNPNQQAHHSNMSSGGNGGRGGGVPAGGAPTSQPRYITKNKYDAVNSRKAMEKKKGTTATSGGGGSKSEGGSGGGSEKKKDHDQSKGSGNKKTDQKRRTKGGKSTF